ncbi:SDR family NAD(P)-dependent oxidoreductase [Nocardia sp. CA-107356]|uniref:SDR family NAD(P)-dependent oxidoreductase n=1 Tax=Nocardia sp. CA-107356 TaxID=3239972 RepID=UPI003D93C4D3
MKVAVVTGGAGAIGTAICTQLVARGYYVLAVDVDIAGLERLPAGVTGVLTDLSAPDFYQHVLTAVDDAGGSCDLLVNNAGIVTVGSIELADPAVIRREQLINLHAPILLTHALLPLLRQSRGQIISVASLASMLPLAESPVYCASKAGLRAFMLSMSLWEKETGVRISLVHPGAVDTPMLRHEATHGGSALNFLSEPLKPETIANAVVANLDRPRLEKCVPRHDGWLVKIVGITPGVLQHIRPLLERAAQSGLQKYPRRNGITLGSP